MASPAEIYAAAISNGCSEKLAEMLACRKAPGAQTDREYFAPHGTLDKQIPNTMLLNSTVAQARRNGYNPSPNDVYVSQLARFPGDPEAFVPATGGRTHVKRVLQKRGWGAEGIVNVKPAQFVPDPPPPVPLSKGIINCEIAKMVQANPDLKQKPREELADAVIRKHGPKT